MSALGTDPRVAFDRAYPFESRYLLYFVKMAMLLQVPEYFQFLDPEQLFDFKYLGFSGPPPQPSYFPSTLPDDYLLHARLDEWVKHLWVLFGRKVNSDGGKYEYYIEKSPAWLPPMIRPIMSCFTIYNLRDPRDIFISANAFMRKRNYLGFARLANDSDVDHARHLALAFVNTFENYYADRKRQDSMMLRYEDFVQNRQKLASDIQTFCGLKPDMNSGFEFFSVHRTAVDLEHSVNRWKTEPIPENVVQFLETCLQPEMSELEYPISQPLTADSWRFISFACNGINLSAIPCSSDGFLEPEDEYASVTIRGIDFWILLPVDPFDARDVKEVWVSARGDIGDVFSLYWHGQNSDFSQDKCGTVPYTPSPQWTVFSFPVHEHPQWQGTISTLRLDLFNAVRPPHTGRGQIRWVRLVG